jgi:hypothetical protein
MVIKTTKYVIATKEFPLVFEDNSLGDEDTESLEDAYFYHSEEEAINELDRYDKPETRQILPVKITYEI